MAFKKVLEVGSYEKVKLFRVPDLLVSHIKLLQYGQNDQEWCKLVRQIKKIFANRCF
jgi:hypothetical protein